MKLEDIFDEWEKDSKIDRQILDQEVLAISTLHAKYHKIFTYERLSLKKLEAELKELKLLKFEFYTQGPTKEAIDAGWRLPPIGKVLKADAGNYVDADRDIINLTLKIGLQHEKITLLESIIRTLQNRGYNIKSAIDFIKFTAGV